MKKILIILYVILCEVIALNAKKIDGISLESYKQDWTDYKAYIVLKNNTNNTIGKVSFRIVYYDMNGKQLHYNDFTEKIVIEPEMSKSLQIDALRIDDEFTAYYTSQEKPYGSKQIKYKIEYQFISCENVVDSYEDLNGKSAYDYYGLNENKFSRLLETVIRYILPPLILVILLRLIGITAKKKGMKPKNWIIWTSVLWAIFFIQTIHIYLSWLSISLPILVLLIEICIPKDDNISNK